MASDIDDLAWQRSIVRASLDITVSAVEAAEKEARAVLYRHALEHAGPMPGKNARHYIEWRNRMDAFEWLVGKRLYRSSGMTF